MMASINENITITISYDQFGDHFIRTVTGTEYADNFGFVSASIGAHKSARAAANWLKTNIAEMPDVTNVSAKVARL